MLKNDWNHLRLSVAVTAEPTLKRGHDLESQKNTVEYDDQSAKKETSALADTSIRFFSPVTSTLVETSCAYLFLVTIFLTVYLCLFSPCVETISSSNSVDFWREIWEKNANVCGEDCYYD